MNRIITICAAVLMTASMFAQSPEKMSYQALIRDASDNLITDTQIGMQISILQGSASGTAVYVETQSPTSNANGLVSLEIGAGTVVSGTFATIDWANGPYFIKTETDPTGGTSYSIIGTSQLLSVPYALHAKTAENGITAQQTSDITANNAKVGYTDALVSANTDVAANTAKTGITTQQASDITANNAKVGYTDALVSANADVAANTAKTGITTQQASDITANNAKVSSASGTQAGEMQYWNGTAWIVVAATTNDGATLQMIGGVPTWTGGTPPTPNVTNPTTSKIWMDRNLGATQVATSSTDAASYGALYQWGRGADGHEIRTSLTTATLSSRDNPGHGDFITITSAPFDWRSPQNTNLWQGVNGVNNPCPSGYRLPTEAELNAERLSWSSNNASGAFASPLKLPMAGFRSISLGSLFDDDSIGYYWSSTVSSTSSRNLIFDSSAAFMRDRTRAYGRSVRCLKD